MKNWNVRFATCLYHDVEIKAETAAEAEKLANQMIADNAGDGFYSDWISEKFEFSEEPFVFELASDRQLDDNCGHSSPEVYAPFILQGSDDEDEDDGEDQGEEEGGGVDS